jgi:hypothetical protein
MKKLEKFIQANRESFEEEPFDGHFERFGAKMVKATGPKRVVFFPKWLKVAVVLVLVVVTSIWTYDRFFVNQQSGLALGEVSPEYREVEQFYVWQVNQKFNEFNQAGLFVDSTQKAMVVKELTEMDSIYNSMKMDLKSSPDDERVINAMIEHYQLKLDIMNHIMEQLEDIKSNEKQTDHENTEI